ncbi:MAG: cytochrome b/b6 domain-containing protein [Paracoccaceae bacterium]
MIANTTETYGLLSRSLHWLTALLIFTAIGLGLYAENLAAASDAEVARLFTIYSLHKTIGVTVFFLALIRLVWTITQPHPAPLHPERRLETFLARAVHWLLWIALLAVPLTGWLHHAATTGFAPIRWPFGQDLPFVSKSDDLAEVFARTHGIATKLLFAALLLHILGALKHALIDRDATLSRMARGTPAPVRAVRHGIAAPALALALWTGVIAAGVLVAPPDRPAPVAAAATAPATPDIAQSAGNWQMRSGSIAFAALQSGAKVTGGIPAFAAAIRFDETVKDGSAGHVTVTMDMASASLGSVTQQVTGPEFFDIARFPAAVFDAEIVAMAGGHVARGTLTIRDKSVRVELPAKITVTDDTAEMSGNVTLDRRDFGLGASYSDDKTVGFPVTVDVALTAARNAP